MMYQKTTKSFDNTELYYVINRKNNERFLFFIHGAGSNHTVYTPFFQAFEDKNFIALDIRSHGKSGKAPLRTITIKNIVRDITIILEQEKIHRIILIGNSLGATVALEFYKQHKKIVQKIVLFTLFSKQYIKWSSVLNLFATLLFILVRPFSGWRTLHFSDYFKYGKRPIWYYPWLDFRGTPIAAVLKLVRELFQTKLYLYNITIPILIFISTTDYSTKNGVIMSDSKTNKNIHIEQINSNHVVLTREYEDVIQRVKRFLEKEK